MNRPEAREWLAGRCVLRAAIGCRRPYRLSVPRAAAAIGPMYPVMDSGILNAGNLLMLSMGERSAKIQKAH